MKHHHRRSAVTRNYRARVELTSSKMSVWIEDRTTQRLYAFFTPEERFANFKNEKCARETNTFFKNEIHRIRVRSQLLNDAAMIETTKFDVSRALITGVFSVSNNFGPRCRNIVFENRPAREKIGWRPLVYSRWTCEI